MLNMNKNGSLKKSQANSAKNARDGISNIMANISSMFQDEQSQKNANTIYTILQLIG